MEIMTKLFVLMFVFILLTGSVSALEWDNVKSFDKSVGKYGKVDIVNAFGFGNKIAEYTLTENTDQCLTNCYAQGTATFYNKGKLFSDLNFKGKDNKVKNLKSFKMFIEVEEHYQETIIDESLTTQNCFITSNGTQSCEYNYVYKDITKTKNVWEEYNFENLDQGNYTWKIEGKKNPKESVDWIISAFGEDLTEWAWWNSSWEKKKEIPISENNGTTLINYTIILNVTYDADMNNDFSDLRFLNSSENEELGHWIESKVDGSSAIVYILVPHLTASSNTSIYMYYNNSGASSTDNVDDAFLWNEEFGGDYDAGDYDVIGTPTVSGGEINFNAASESIRLATTLPNPNTDLILTANVRYVLVNINYAVWGLGAAASIYTASDGIISRDGGGSHLQIFLSEFDSGAGSRLSGSIGNAHTGLKIYDMFIAYNTSLAHNLTNVNDSSTVTLSKGVVPLFRPLMGIDTGGTNFWVDYMRIRKLVIPVPTFSFGTEQEFTSVTTTLISPVDNYNSSLDNIVFSVNSTPRNINLTNVTLYIWHSNSTLFLTNFTSLSGNETVTTNWTILNIPDGSFIWNALTKGTDGKEAWGVVNRTFEVDANPPLINVTFPTGLIDFHIAGDNLTLNWSVSDVNLDSCWFAYNATNTTVTCGDNNFSFITTAQKNLTFYANDTFGNLASNFTSWQIILEKFEITFNNQTFERSQEDFRADVILGVDETISQAIFFYNNTNFTTNIFFSGGEYVITSSILIPLVEAETNFSFGFFIVVAGETFNSPTFNQTVLNMNLSVCSPGGNVLLNVSLKDEILKSSLVGDIEINAQTISKTSDEITSSIGTSFLNVSSGAICLFPLEAFDDLYLDAEIKYSSEGYAPELYHIQKADISEYPKNLSLFDLANNLSTEFLVKYQDDDLISVEGAVIQLQRKYISEDLFEIVEAPLTSDIGTSIVHIDLNTNKYQATVVKDGVVLDVFLNLVFNCENPLSGQCTENLFGQIDSQNDVPLTELTDFVYSISSVNNTITTLFIIPSGTPASVNILLTQVDQFGNSSACNQTLISSGGSIDCTFEDTIGDSFLELKLSKDAELQAEESFIIVETSGLDFLGNNFFIVIIFLLSLVGMSFSSPEWMIMNAVLTMTISGAFWLIKGLDFVVGLGSLMYLIIAAGILIKELAKQEDR